MSDFPKGGDVGSTRVWLTKKGFAGLFVDWEADALLGLEERHVQANGGRDWLKLWGFLNTARQHCNFIYYFLNLNLFADNLKHFYHSSTANSNIQTTGKDYESLLRRFNSFFTKVIMFIIVYLFLTIVLAQTLFICLFLSVSQHSQCSNIAQN
jgi:hypothetical protein